MTWVLIVTLFAQQPTHPENYVQLKVHGIPDMTICQSSGAGLLLFLTTRIWNTYGGKYECIPEKDGE